MNGLCNTFQPLCSRCQVNPRLKKQRWCRACLTASQRARRVASHTDQAAEASAGVTHAPTQAMPSVTQAPQPPALSPEAVPTAGASTSVTQAQRQALQEYWNAVHALQVRRQLRQGWLQDRSTILVPLEQQVKHARQRLVTLGINPEALRGG